MKVAVIGAGWAGCAAAVEALRLGHEVTLYESTRIAGGRARRLAQGDHHLDNGQHILIGAYSECLKLMADLGVDLNTGLKRLPLALQFPDGSGLKLAHWPVPLDALAGIACAGGWSWGDKFALLKICIAWRLSRFSCAPETSVAQLCQALPKNVLNTLIEPLCISALNTPMERASGQVFLRVLHDALLSSSGGSNLLLPLKDLSALLPEPALAWLTQHGASVQMASRVQQINQTKNGWQVQTEGSAPMDVDAIILACPALEAARLVDGCDPSHSLWIEHVKNLSYEPITTVYGMASGTRLTEPMLALPSSRQYPAQFVFDRGQLGGPAGLLAFVISASNGDSKTLTQQVLAQAAQQLGLTRFEPIKTIIEKRATFACTPNLIRPAMQIGPGLLACGDYIAGPYPATLEGAVRSGLAAARAISSKPNNLKP